MTLSRTTELKRTPFKRTMPTERKVRMRKCAVKTCRALFQPMSMTHKCCSPECAILDGQLEKERKARKERQEGLAKLKRRGDWMKEAQQAFNAYRREWCRVNGYSNCPSCGGHLDWNANKVDAGHYRSVGSAPHLRFVENNVWAQCKKCNQYGGGRAVDYRIGLIARIGVEAVEALESDNTPRQHSIEDLKAIKATSKQKLKELKERS
jgi:hypothetical protein